MRKVDLGEGNWKILWVIFFRSSTRRIHIGNRRSLYLFKKRFSNLNLLSAFIAGMVILEGRRVKGFAAVVCR